MDYQDNMDFDCAEKKPTLNEGYLYFDAFNGLLWEICPLDSSHYCRKQALKDHIDECKQCLKGPRKVECPFNAMHIVNLMQIEHHIMTCEYRIVQTNGLCDFEPKRETVEGVAMEPINVAIRIPNTWEDGKNPDTGYDAMEATKFRAIMRAPPPGMTKRQKKDWHLQERQRMKWLTGETKEKPRGVPYPTANQIKNAKAASKQVAAVKSEDEIIEVIDKLGSANIADPRDAMMKRITTRSKALRLLEAKVKEEKLALQRLVEQYLASIGKTDEQADFKIESNVDECLARNVDPRIAGRNANNDPRTANSDRVPRIIPDMMTPAMVR